MSTATLKKSLGEAGAFFDDSNGEDNLLDVLTALCNTGEVITFKDSASPPTTGYKASLVCDVASRIGTLYINVGTTGTAGQTDVDVYVNGSSVAQATIDHTDADGTSTGVSVDEDVDAGDLVEINVTAVATGAANVTGTLRMKPVTVET